MEGVAPGGMSAREAEVLELVARGLSNAQISRELVISVRTVESHVSALLRKCGVANRAGLTEYVQVARLRQTTNPRFARVAGMSAPRTSFVGRERERNALRAAVADARLVSLLGPGGVGKTRVVQEFIADLAVETDADATFVDLVGARPGGIPLAVAAALGVEQTAQATLEQAVVVELRKTRALLILDNCEHLLDEVAAFVELLLPVCAGTVVLATSRERLGLPGERVISVGPLRVGSEAEALFRDRATAANPDFDPDPQAVSLICARLDGMPLAIELAAARSASLGMDGLIVAVQDRLRLLRGSRVADSRHRSLRALLDWSFGLLSKEERELFCEVAIFAGRFDLDAVAQVTTTGSPTEVADLLGSLADKSLVQYEAGRWRLLETVRDYAIAQLDETGHDELRGRYLIWAAGAVQALIGRMNDQSWRTAFDAIGDDLRAALTTAPLRPDETSHQLALGLARLNFARRFLQASLDAYRQAAQLAPTRSEAADNLRAAAACAHTMAASNQAFELLLAAAEQYRMTGEHHRARAAIAQAVEMVHRFPAFFAPEIPAIRLRALAAEAAVAAEAADPTAGDVSDLAAQLQLAAAWSIEPPATRPDPDLAAAALRKAEAAGAPILICAALDAMSTVHTNAGRIHEAQALTRRRLALSEAMDPHDPRAAIEIEDTHYVAYTDAITAGDAPAAIAATSRDLRGQLHDNHPYVSAGLRIPALILLGQFTAATEHATMMWREWRRAGRPSAAWMSPAACCAALAHGMLGDDDGFTLWRARAAEIAGSDPSRLLDPLLPFVDARVALHRGNWEQAPAIVDSMPPQGQTSRFHAYAYAAVTELAVVVGLPIGAELLTSVRPAILENKWAAACLVRAAGRFHNDTTTLTAAVDQFKRLDARAELACALLLIPGHADEGNRELASLGIPPPAHSPSHNWR